MAEIIGLAIIVLALGIGCWRFYKGRKLPATGMGLLVLACFIGVALVLNKRVSELSFGKLATLKATVTQAQSDAEQIAAIRQRIEAQAATMDLVAKESADAKRLLADLKKENAVAEEKLRMLEQKTEDFGQLPDGRIMTGGLVVGRASIVINELTNLTSHFVEKKFNEALAIAKDCIKRYEDSAELTKGAKASMGDVTVSGDGVQSMYEIGVKSAVIGNEYETAAKWARSALLHRQTPEMNAFLVLALVKTGKADEAQTLVDQKLKQGGSDAEVFKKVLRETGVMKTP